MRGEKKRVDGGLLSAIDKNTKTQNNREELLKGMLLKKNITSWYEPCHFRIAHSEKSYLPDFVTSIFIGGRQVLIEWHTNKDTKYCRKLEAIKDYYNFYIVLAYQVNENEYSKIRGGMGYGNNKGKMVDELWAIPYPIKKSPEMQRREAISALSSIKIIGGAFWHPDIGAYGKLLRETFVDARAKGMISRRLEELLRKGGIRKDAERNLARQIRESNKLEEQRGLERHM